MSNCLQSGKPSEALVLLPSWIPFADLCTRSLYAEYVHVLVGPAKQDFGVHKGLLCKCSKFFQAALNGSFAEASKGVVELPEGNPKVFEIVHKWLYTHKLTVVKNGEDVKCYEDQLVDLFIFGDTFGIPTLCNSVIDAIVHNFEEDNIVITHSIRRVYNGTLEGSPLRKLIIATYINDPDDISNFLSKNSECFMACPQFLLDLAKAYEFKTKRTLQVLTKLRRIENVAQYYQSVDL